MTSTKAKRKKGLSDRLRPDCEAAPWVIDEIKALEQENLRLRDALRGIASAQGMMQYSLELWPVILMDKARKAIEE